MRQKERGSRSANKTSRAAAGRTALGLGGNHIFSIPHHHFQHLQFSACSGLAVAIVKLRKLW